MIEEKVKFLKDFSEKTEKIKHELIDLKNDIKTGYSFSFHKIGLPYCVLESIRLLEKFKSIVEKEIDDGLKIMSVCMKKKGPKPLKDHDNLR